MHVADRGAFVSPASVLVVDDSATARTLVEQRLTQMGHRVTTAADGDAALTALGRAKADLIILDVEMPRLDGWETLRLLRTITDAPVIMLTAHDTEPDRVRGLRGGADDYLGKDASVAELAARVAAVLRRTRRGCPHAEAYDDGVLRLDRENAEVTVRGEPVRLTPMELRLLKAFTSSPGLVLSPEQLLQRVWGWVPAGGNERIRLYVGYLRAKIGSELIENVRGRGYRYVPRAGAPVAGLCEAPPV
jgi:DNA-binding response OmpR family regulator